MFQAYGIVWRAIDKKKNHVVALKKIFDAFQNATDAQRTYREAFFLQVLSDLHNMLKYLHVYCMISSFRFCNMMSSNLFVSRQNSIISPDFYRTIEIADISILIII